jgi:hypothetical protein
MAEILLIKTEKKLSKVQENFNKVIIRIEKSRNDIIKFQNDLNKFETTKNKALGELIAKRHNSLIAYCKLIDGYYESNLLSKVEKEKIFKIITVLTMPSEDGEPLHKEVEFFALKYAKIESNNLSDKDKAMGKAMINEMLKEAGIDFNFGKDDNLNIDEMRAKIEELMREKDDEAQDEINYKKKNKHGSQISEKEKVAAEELQKSWKKIYLELIKKLHPDTEVNEALKLEKNEAMKEVTTAYEDNNFYKLLLLQIKYNNGENGFDKFDDTMLKDYYKILKQQELDLKFQISQIKMIANHLDLAYLGKPQFENYLDAKISDMKWQTTREINQYEMEVKKLNTIEKLKKELKKVSVNDLQYLDSDDLEFLFL